jgi:aspartate aminotransferase
MIPLSKLAASVQPSATLAAAAKARQLKAAGTHVFDFSVGEPDFNTPEHICAAATAAMKAGHTHYTPTAGIPEVRKAIVAWYERYHGFKLTPEQVLVSNGAKHSLHNTLEATVGPGDEVVIPTPYWVSYSELVEMTGAKAILVHTSPKSGFKMSPAQLRSAITPRSKLLMINSPCNPTGVTYTRRELEQIADVVLESSLTVLSDEIYEQLTYGDAKPTCFATLRPGLADRTITVSGASKSYAMTGWRMGWAAGPKAIITAMGNIQSQQTSCPSSISQHALIAALNGPQDCVASMRSEFKRRRELACGLLDRIPGITYPKPTGAFYVFFDVSKYFGKAIKGGPVNDSAAFCAAALEAAHVNLVQGSAFGCEGFARLSFATSDDQIRQGLTRLAEWLAG